MSFEQEQNAILSVMHRIYPEYMHGYAIAKLAETYENVKAPGFGALYRHFETLEQEGLDLLILPFCVSLHINTSSYI